MVTAAQSALLKLRAPVWTWTRPKAVAGTTGASVRPARLRGEAGNPVRGHRLRAVQFTPAETGAPYRAGPSSRGAC